MLRLLNLIGIFFDCVIRNIDCDGCMEKMYYFKLYFIVYICRIYNKIVNGYIKVI